MRFFVLALNPNDGANLWLKLAFCFYSSVLVPKIACCHICLLLSLVLNLNLLCST